MELIHSKTLHTQIHGRSLIPLMQEKPFDEQPIFLHTIPHEEIDENAIIVVNKSDLLKEK